MEETEKRSRDYTGLRDGETNKMDTLKVLLPLRSGQRHKTRSRMDTTGLIGTLMYTFLTSVFWKAHRQGITQDTLTRLMSDRDAAAINCERFERLWKEETDRVGEENASLKRVIFQFVKTRFLTSCAVLVVGLSSGFLLTAYVLYTAILYLEESTSSVGYCVALAFSIFASTACRVVGMNFTWYINIRTAARVRNALMLTLYKKVARLRSTSDISVGEMVNICVNDMQRLFDATIYGPVIIAFPLFVLLILVGCVLIIGAVPTLVGTAMLIIIFSCQACLAKLNIGIRQTCIEMTDCRTRLLNEVLNCIKLIKMYAWEDSFTRNITAIRRHERKHLERAGYLSSYTLGMALTACPAVILAAVICNKLMGSDITAAEAFTLMQLFGSLSTIMYIMPIAMKPITESIVSIRRIQPILLMDEISQTWEVPKDPGHALVLSNASFSWEAPPRPEPDPNEASAEVNANKYAPIVDADDAHREDKGGGMNGTGLLQDGGSSSVTQALILKDISLVVPTSHLVGVCGAVASGKSSLLSCLLDQMNLRGGTVELRGTFAYAAQQAWITNATVRENILFGEPYNEEKYKKAIYSCCLERDLEIMSDGDRTEIGERGVNVSGGQKQRISLARAYYSDRDIYLLDDPLSAVDAHVGKHIFNHCIRGALRGKTVLFVSHQLQYLRDCDHVVLMQDGAISEQGTHDELIAADGEYARLIDTFHGKGENKSRNTDDARSGSNVDAATARGEGTDIDYVHEGPMKEKTCEDPSEAVKLINEEERGSGMVAYATYRSFVKYAGGPCLAIINVVFMFLSMLAAISTSVWLSIWIQDTVKWKDEMVSFDTAVVNATAPGSILPRYNVSIDGYYGDADDEPFYIPDPTAADEDRTGFFILVYIGIFLICFIILGITCLVYILTLVRATTRIHDCLLRKIMQCPMSFFDTTPLGRILNRFSKDMDEVDLMLPINLMRCLIFISLLIVIQIVIGVVLPYYLLAFAVVVPMGLVVYIIFRRGYCEIKRYDNTSRSTLVSHISATVQGLVTIRAYGQEQRFTSRFEELLDINSHALQLFTMAPRWVAVRMDIMATVLVGVLTLLVLLSKGSVLSTPLAAMALYQAIMVSGGLLQEVVLSSTQTESSFISVERILEYIEKTPSEADVSIAETKPPTTWPSSGDLKLRQVKMRYRPELPLVLKGITCHIQPGEKIGIVGRTGSGKSSLGVCLFRLVELSSGEMFLDDVDISTISLHDLRSRLSIIPQDPVLFAGTVRFNLDPLHEHWDEDLWDALEKTHLKQTISGLDKQLEAPVIENGENFSVGERQLICMARVLLRNSKVLLMDEATAAIDTETDSLIQQTIREAFKDCTMLIIAHRLNTVLDCDKIMVLDKGQILEFGTPEVLVADTGSHFSQMLAAMDRNHGDLD